MKRRRTPRLGAPSTARTPTAIDPAAGARAVGSRRADRQPHRALAGGKRSVSSIVRRSMILCESVAFCRRRGCTSCRPQGGAQRAGARCAGTRACSPTPSARPRSAGASAAPGVLESPWGRWRCHSCHPGRCARPRPWSPGLTYTRPRRRHQPAGAPQNGASGGRATRTPWPDAHGGNGGPH